MSKFEKFTKDDNKDVNLDVNRVTTFTKVEDNTWSPNKYELKLEDGSKIVVKESTDSSLKSKLNK